MTNLSQILFHNTTKTMSDIESMFPPRDLPDGAKVTRLAPSPTGFIHLGNLYGAIIDERLAHQSGGTFYLRIEDTDEKREVPGAVDIVIGTLNYFGITFDEGATVDGETGAYGPYRQRQRKDIYHVFAKYLVEKGMAYPCFMTEQELADMRTVQESEKANFGYYGKWAKHRDLSIEEIETRIGNGESYVLRFRSNGKDGVQAGIIDGIRGELKFQENFTDFVLLKSDGIPTYHFAHVVDDHLMRTTHVVRGEEWLATLPIHVQLFDSFGWRQPVYCHTAQLMKMDGTSKRKLSKRLDPELGLEFYKAEGYSPSVVWEYLMTVLNSNFEEWRIANPGSPMAEFAFTTEKMSNSGALFDLAKLNDIGKDVVCKMTADEVYAAVAAWASEFDTDFAKIFTANPQFSVAALAIGRGADKPRKDFANWTQAKEYLSFFYDELFTMQDEFPQNIDAEERSAIVSAFLATYDYADDKTQWFDKVRETAVKLGYAAQPKEYKKNPEMYKGHVGDVSGVLRVAVTGRSNSPDLWEVFQALGEECVRNRLLRA